MVKVIRWLAEEVKYCMLYNFRIDVTSGGLFIIHIHGSAKAQPAVQELFKSLLQYIISVTNPLMHSQKQYLLNQQHDIKTEIEFYNKTDSGLLKMMESANSNVASIQSLIYMGRQQKTAQLHASLNLLQQQLTSLRDSHYISSLLRSSPLGTSAIVMLILVLMMALFLACIGVFVVEFFVNAKS